MEYATMKFAVVVPWVTGAEIEAFLSAWGLSWSTRPDWLYLQNDHSRNGCAVTKNLGIRRAVDDGAEIVVVLDGDCFPDTSRSLESFVEEHCSALSPVGVDLFQIVTDPPSRGTPYQNLKVIMPVAASVGFWSEIGDYCAVRQLAHNASPMTFQRSTIFGRFFPLCGMNLAFKPSEWYPWCSFIDVPRFDDIWMGWLWQKEAYRRGFCFNLGGPLVRHARQSNVWKNLCEEAVYLERNETLWSDIAASTEVEYEKLLKILPTSL
jgi:hypothetical protein